MNKIELLEQDDDKVIFPLEGEDGVIVSYRVMDILTLPETNKQYVILAPLNYEEGDPVVAARIRITEDFEHVELTPIEDEELMKVRDACMELLTDLDLNELDESSLATAEDREGEEVK